MEIMDIRERVDELIQRNELEGLAQIFGEISARILKIVGEIGHCFQEDKLEDVRNLVYKLVYFYRIQERIDPYIPTA